MSAKTVVTICCAHGVLPNGIRPEGRACPTTYVTEKATSLDEARSEAGRKGWGFILDDDWCPAHEEARTLAKAIKPIVRALGWVNDPDATDRSLALRSLHSDDGVVGLVEATVYYDHPARGRLVAFDEAESADLAIVRAVAKAGGPPVRSGDAGEQGDTR